WGPLVGLTWMAAHSQELDTKLQSVFENRDRSYTPFMTQFGVALEQRLPLGQTASHFAFQEVLAVTGVDQGVALPSLSVLLGFRSHAGLQLGLG
ncbi:hypothetical protein LZP69_16425, partial [Shewanella sp. AS1]|uniref:hypothetical protein n=1 Tax=Shewanella sp. AS1 TaxID=2907626 RepID=UPI001F2D8447